MDLINQIIAEIFKLDTVDNILDELQKQKDTILEEIKKIFPRLSPSVMLVFGMLFEMGITELSMVETKENLVDTINFWLTELHKVIITSMDIINDFNKDAFKPIAEHLYNSIKSKAVITGRNNLGSLIFVINGNAINSFAKGSLDKQVVYINRSITVQLEKED